MTFWNIRAEVSEIANNSTSLVREAGIAKCVRRPETVQNLLRQLMTAILRLGF
jgi:hypothetical protein